MQAGVGRGLAPRPCFGKRLHRLANGFASGVVADPETLIFQVTQLWRACALRALKWRL